MFVIANRFVYPVPVIKARDGYCYLIKLPAASNGVSKFSFFILATSSGVLNSFIPIRFAMPPTDKLSGFAFEI